MSIYTDNWIDQRKDQIVETLRSIVRFRTVEGPAEDGAPFGPEVKACLQETLSAASGLGLEVRDLDGYCGTVDAGSGDEMLGILAHLDVVPEGTGWHHDPYGAELEDGKIWGRGTLDDKGPAVASIFALAAAAASGMEFKRKVRIILGCNEETNMGCIRYYLAHERTPELSFSPDGEYPLTNSEKSILHCTYKAKFNSRISMNVGEAPNVVPGEASCVLEGYFGSKEISAVGKIAHASLPWEGRNALQELLLRLKAEDLMGMDRVAVDALCEAFKDEYYGQSIGLDKADDSGRLTLNLGVMRWNSEGFELTLDLRCPVTLPECYISERIELALAATGGKIVSWKYKPGYSIPDDAEIVKKLLRVYKDRTGDETAKPKRIGGGTYSRELPNAVSFGPEGYMCTASCHVADEHMGVDQMIMNTKMIADAIIALACE
ncbi:MAG: Sapep family Mn(2+)-dependent dipeptidase [Firmicutes bacterium]|nr:Sapep family Mn(2+)-dependent dipeptidase [Bacillota bacterium]